MIDPENRFTCTVNLIDISNNSGRFASILCSLNIISYTNNEDKSEKLLS